MTTQCPKDNEGYHCICWQEGSYDWKILPCCWCGTLEGPPIERPSIECPSNDQEGTRP